MGKTNGQALLDALEAAIDVGEGAYQNAREAVRELDINDDKKAGVARVRALLGGLDAFATRLERFANGAEILARKAADFVR